ncbi:hypothetical protein OH782_42555 (plasmid) [Streptomyces sp. NBC_01544]|uniref:hypothetical protein n=1 Tax=Streptomyces sp. NBC_01544 TaxID=2975871 RepID=UPI002F90BF3C
MGTPTPGEPFAEATGEAVQTSIMAMRLVMAIADAVRRHKQEQEGKEEELPPAKEAVAEAAEGIKGMLAPDISAALTASADWPQMAQQLVALRRAGVDMGDFLPRVGDLAVTVRDAVAANEARVMSEGTGQWEKLLRETLPAGPVREAILSSPSWPDIAATMGRLEGKGVDVRQILVAAHTEGVGVDQAVGRVLSAGEPPATSKDAMLSYGPLTTGLDVPRNFAHSDRARALRQLAISPQENERYMRFVREAMPGREREADLLVAANRWPLLAARMARMEDEGKPLGDHLARLMKDTSWEQGAGAQVGSRLVLAVNDALRKPLAESAATGTGVNTAAARARSSTVGPTRAAGVKGAAPAEATVAAHREAAPAPARGKTR